MLSPANVIDDNCIGCTMCSKGSFGSIRMHPIAELDMEKYFPNRSPDAKGKAIAQKCDNCTGYEDKACISACPEVLYFNSMAPIYLIIGDNSVRNPLPMVWPLKVPTSSPMVGVNSAALTVFVTVFLSWECFGRLYWPKVTFAELFFQLGWSESGVDPIVFLSCGTFLVIRLVISPADL